jgi:hypothetical protein
MTILRILLDVTPQSAKKTPVHAIKTYYLHSAARHRGFPSIASKCDEQSGVDLVGFRSVFASRFRKGQAFVKMLKRIGKNPRRGR